MLLLPKTDSQAADRLISDITSKIEGYNRANKNALYAVNLSIGHSTKEEEDQHIEDVLRSAEESLKRKKLLNQNSAHSAIVSSIMATLYAKSQETEEHGQRLGSFCRMIGEKLGLEEKSLYDLQLLSKLHDIGKIGIRDQLLNKPGKLTEAEWREMELHPEIGNRIAMATPQLEHIAGYILHHHERWDGKGYPMGLKGQEIPIIARILTIADAYDAMTEDRVYRKALPPETALEEIERNAGTQFDPDIARLFVELIRKQLKDGNLPT
jgi:HD-GYP domain-containing protein (c-di-GMP phosphodiesterase class II)